MPRDLMYQDETHPPMLNELTKKLFSQGYSRENHPEYVYWNDWQNLGYKWDYLLALVWETPCGLMIDGKSGKGRFIAISDTYHNGIWYCPENDNPAITCPLRKTDCSHRIPFGKNIIQCPVKQTIKPYDYENSIERLEKEHIAKAYEQWMEITGGSYCACIVGNNGYNGGYYQVKYDVMNCIRYGMNGCKNEFCVIRKKPRDLTKVNIYYDIRRTHITKQGLIEDKRVELTKGVKVFDHPIFLTDAEIWLKYYRAEKMTFNAKKNPDDRRMQFFSKNHRSWPGYDYFEFHYEVENFRIEKKAGRDLMQDLQDAAEGIEIRHNHDDLKAAKEQKRERRAKAKKARVEKIKKRIIDTGYHNMKDFEQRRVHKLLTDEEFEDCILAYVNQDKKLEQVSNDRVQMVLFGADSEVRI